MVAAKDSRGWTALSYAVASGRTAAVEAIVALVERTVPADKVGERSLRLSQYLSLRQSLLSACCA